MGITENFAQEEHCAQLHHSIIKQMLYLLSLPLQEAITAFSEVWYNRCKPQT